MSDQEGNNLSRRDALRIAGVASALSVGLGVVLEGHDAMAATAIKGTTSLKLDSATALKVSMEVYKLDGANFLKVASLPLGATAHKSAGMYIYKLVAGDQTLSEQSVEVTK